MVCAWRLEDVQGPLLIVMVCAWRLEDVQGPLLIVMDHPWWLEDDLVYCVACGCCRNWNANISNFCLFLEVNLMVGYALILVSVACVCKHRTF